MWEPSGQEHCRNSYLKFNTNIKTAVKGSITKIRACTKAKIGAKRSVIEVTIEIFVETLKFVTHFVDICTSESDNARSAVVAFGQNFDWVPREKRLKPEFLQAEDPNYAAKRSRFGSAPELFPTISWAHAKVHAELATQNSNFGAILEQCRADKVATKALAEFLGDLEIAKINPAGTAIRAPTIADNNQGFKIQFSANIDMPRGYTQWLIVSLTIGSLGFFLICIVFILKFYKKAYAAQFRLHQCLLMTKSIRFSIIPTRSSKQK